MKLEEFTNKIREQFAGNLRSIILYGSAVGSDFSKRHSDYNLILVVNDADPQKISCATKLLRKWQSYGNPTPYIFDPDHIERSLDVFPLEFLDIKRQHRVIFGDDPFKSINIDKTNLRHQCESELKGKLLHLRSFFATNADKPKELQKMMLKSFPTITALLRGVLHLMDINPKESNSDVISQLSQKIGFKDAVFTKVIDARIGRGELPKGEEMKNLFAEYLTEMGKITIYVDKCEQCL